MKRPVSFMYYNRLRRRWENCTIKFLLAINNPDMDICPVYENSETGESVKWSVWLEQNADLACELSNGELNDEPKRPEPLEPKEGDDSMAAAVQLLRMIWRDQQETNKLARAFYTVCLIAAIASAASYIMSSLFGR